MTTRSTRPWGLMALFGALLASPIWADGAMAKPAPLCSAHPGSPPHAAHPQGAARAGHAATHVCPMHPEVRQAGPGRCPKCKMKLVPLPASPRPRR